MARALVHRPGRADARRAVDGPRPDHREELYELVAQVAKEGVSILVVEQFARTVLGVADVAGLMLHGRVVKEGSPAELEAELEAAYLGAET
jgi:branched-chain amino acid transport system ATP-binding protein